MIRKLKAGGYRLYSRKKNPKTGQRRNLGTFSTRAAAEKHEREVQYFKKH
jgi:cell division septation protein DedD